MQPFNTLRSRIIALPDDNIDTDQIIPARFLKTTSKTGLGDRLFADWRYNPDGTPRPDFCLNRAEAWGTQILLTGDNFGCGSSREHAPWALNDFGFRVVISTSFADIFRQNALKNGLLPVIVDSETHRQLFSLVGEDPETEVTVDLVRRILTLPDGRSVTFPIDEFSKTCLMEGIDQLEYLLQQEIHISTYEEKHPAPVNTAVS